MTLRAIKAVSSAINLTWACDTLLTLTKADCINLVGKNVCVRAGYIDHVTPQELADQTSVGIAFMPVTYALEFDASRAIARLQALGIPTGVTVWLDVEGMNLDPMTTIVKIDAWANAIAAAGYEAGLYVGAGCPLTSTQLSWLAVTRYWHSCSIALEPGRGYCVIQLRPNDVTIAGRDVDINVIQPDYRGDLPTVAAA